MELIYYSDSDEPHSIYYSNSIWLNIDLRCDKCGKNQGAPNYFSNNSRCITCGYHDENITQIIMKLEKIETLANQVKPFIYYNEFPVIDIVTQISFTYVISYLDEYIDKLEYLKLTHL